MKEILKNNPQTSLSAAALNTDTTLSVADGTVFPSTGRFRIICDSEIMVVTARSANTLTVQRAQESTAAAGHASAAPVTQILTTGGLTQWARENVAGFDGSRPPLALQDASGNTLTSASFTVVNLSTSTIADQDGGIVLRKPGNATVGENITALARTKPAAPATLIVGLRANLPRDRTSGFPISLAGFRESSTGKMMFCHLVNNGGPQLQAAKYTNETTQSSIIVAAQDWAYSADILWFRAVDDGTNLTLSLGIDGVNWVQLFSEARTAYMTGGPDQFIWGSNNSGNGYDCLTTLVSWTE